MNSNVPTFDHSRPIRGRELREAECARITALMNERRPFSFLRLGDMELTSLVCWQQNKPLPWKVLDENSIVSSAVIYGHPGLTEKYSQRLQAAYENCHYLDYHDGWRTNQRDLPHWHHSRSMDLFRNPGPEVSQLFFDWAEREFGGYISGRRIMMAGAEAGLLQELYVDPTYRAAAKEYWPANSDVVFFPEVRRNEQLDDILSDIRTAVVREKIDTLFLSLGGASKIICYELAKELGICTFDFGSLMRALTYSGSDGHNFFRAVHYPFLFRVPFSVYMAALRRSAPSLTPSQLLAKAHSQLILELVRKEVGWSYANEYVGNDCLDFCQRNMEAFNVAYRVYLRDYRHLGDHDSEAARQRDEFDKWIAQHKVGFRGQMLHLRGKAKRFTARIKRILVGSGSK